MNLTETDRITEPGFYRIPEPVYHADPCPAPSLSSSIARKLINDSPRHAWTDHPMLNPDWEPDEPSNRLEYGSACHRILLGKGSEIDVLPFKTYQSNAAKEARAEAIDVGLTPIKEDSYHQALEMVEAFKAQINLFPDYVSTLFGAGTSEAVIAWQESGFWCRSMIDKLYIGDDRVVMFDYKTTEASASPYAVGKRLFDMGYDVQSAFYRRGLEALLGADRTFSSYIVSQEVKPPYAVSVVELSHEAWQLAGKKVLAALALWERCIKGDAWPSYPPIVATATLPSWHEQMWLEREVNDDLLKSVDIAGFAKPLELPAKPIAGPC